MVAAKSWQAAAAIGWLCWLCSSAAVTARAGETDLLDLALSHRFTDPQQARYSQYRILSGLQELSALSDQADTSTRRQEVSAALEAIGRAYRNLGMPVLAAFYFDQALQVAPESSHLQAELGTILVQIGEDELGRRLLTQALEASDAADHRRTVAVSWVLLGEYGTASSLLRQVISKGSSDSDRQYAWLLNQALQPLLAEQTNPEQANPENVRPAKGKAEKAKQEKKPVNNEKEWPGVLVSLQQQADEQALAAHLLKIQTEDSDRFREQLCEALFFRGMYWKHQGQRDRAHAYFNAVLQMNLPSFLETQLARYFLQLDQPVQPAARGASMDPMPIS